MTGGHLIGQTSPSRELPAIPLPGIASLCAASQLSPAGPGGLSNTPAPQLGGTRIRREPQPHLTLGQDPRGTAPLASEAGAWAAQGWGSQQLLPA